VPRSLEGHRRRVLKLEARLTSTALDHMPYCTIPDPATGKPCGQPTARAAKTGLSGFMCRRHQQHAQRHGSPWCKTPPVSTIRPYLVAALSYIATQQSDPFISAALAGLKGLIECAGPVEIATRLRGLPPEQRARIALARLREANVEPVRLLAIPLAISALIEDAPALVHRTREWRVVAIAKAAHRLASGTHRQWSVPQSNGGVKRTEMHAYPPSRGQILRHLGGMIEKECELVIDHHLSSVLALKTARGTPMQALPTTP
jgi:hypothetical protein